jgi:hypothetical protein
VYGQYDARPRARRSQIQQQADRCALGWARKIVAPVDQQNVTLPYQTDEISKCRERRARFRADRERRRNRNISVKARLSGGRCENTDAQVPPPAKTDLTHLRRPHGFQQFDDLSGNTWDLRTGGGTTGAAEAALTRAGRLPAPTASQEPRQSGALGVD